MKRLILSIMLLASGGILAWCTQNADVNVTGTGTIQQSGSSMSGATFVNASGAVVYSGDIKDNTQEGRGISYYDNGNVQYRGQRFNGKAEGTGTLYYPNGQVAYVGHWDNGEPDGFGTWYYLNGQIAYQGWFDNGDPEGTGRILDMSGNVLYEGVIKSHKFDLKLHAKTNARLLSGWIFTSGFLDNEGSLRVNALFFNRRMDPRDNNDRTDDRNDRDDDNDNDNRRNDDDERVNVQGRGSFRGWINRTWDNDGRDRGDNDRRDDDRDNNDDNERRGDDNDDNRSASVTNKVRAKIDLYK